MPCLDDSINLFSSILYQFQHISNFCHSRVEQLSAAIAAYMDISTHGRTFRPMGISPHGHLAPKTIRQLGICPKTICHTDAVNINNQKCPVLDVN